MTKLKMIASMIRYFNKVEELVDGIATQIDESKTPIVFVETTIAAGDKWTRNLVTNFPTAAQFDMRSSLINVLVKDEGATSVTKDKWVNSEAIITVATNAAGVVDVYNYDDVAHTVLIQISKPVVRLI